MLCLTPVADKFSTLCRVTATLPTTIYRKQQGLHGYYFEAKFDVVLLFGLTELKAQLSWKENVRSFIVEQP